MCVDCGEPWWEEYLKEKGLTKELDGIPLHYGDGCHGAMFKIKEDPMAECVGGEDCYVCNEEYSKFPSQVYSSIQHGEDIIL